MAGSGMLGRARFLRAALEAVEDPARRGDGDVKEVRAALHALVDGLDDETLRYLYEVARLLSRG